MKAVDSFETSADGEPATHCNKSEDLNPCRFLILSVTVLKVDFWTLHCDRRV